MGKAGSNYDGFLQEELRDRLDYITEALDALKGVPADIIAIKADLADMRQWRNYIDPAVRDISRLVNSHEFRITTLEAK